MNLNRRNVLLAVLAAGLAVPTALQLRADAETFVDITRVPLLFDGFTSDNLGSLRLRQPKVEPPPVDPANPNAARATHDELVFQKSDKGWVFAQGELTGAPVGKERVESDLLQHLRSIRADRDALVQQNATPTQLAEYGLDDEHAFVVQAFDSQNRNLTADLLVGRDAALGQSGTDAVRGVFVRKSDSTDVILYEFDKGWRRDVKSELWLDKVLARVPTEKIQKFSLRNAATAGTTFTFERRDGKASWHPVDPPAGLGALRQTEVETLVQRLGYLAAQDFRMPLQKAGNLQQLGLLPPQIEFEVHWKDGDRDRVLKLAVGNKLDGKNEYYLTSNESVFLMTWPAGNAVPFEVDVKAQWFDPAPPASDPPPGGGK
jgi:Domain of unknown function (DUF4340)